MSATEYPGDNPFGFRGNLFGRIRRRILASIAAATAWVSFTLLYVAFWATHFSLFQDIVIVFVSLLILTAVLLGSWVSIGIGFFHDWFE